jgi:hypothetical protein
MQDLNQLIGKTFQEGIYFLGLNADTFNFVYENEICEVNYEHTDMNCDNEATIYIITFTLTEKIKNEGDEDTIEANFFINPETFNYAGYWHFEEVK